LLATSNEIIAAWLNHSRQLSIRVKVNDVTYGSEEITSLSFDSGSISGEVFQIGSTYMNSVQIVFPSIIESIAEDIEVIPELGVMVNGSYEYTKLGHFYVDDFDRNKNNNTTSITATDKMRFMEGEYISKLIYPKAYREVALDVANSAGVEVSTNSFASLGIGAINQPEGYTHRQAIGLIAQFEGGFASFNRNGELEIRRLAPTTFEITPESYLLKGFTKNEASYRIGGISVKTGEEETDVIRVGSTNGSQVELENKVMTKTLLNKMWELVKTLNYFPYELKWRGCPPLEAGDWIYISDKDGNKYSVPNLSYSITFNGGMSAESKALTSSTSQATYKYRGSLNQKIDYLDSVLSANKWNTNYYDQTEPSNPKEGDIWFKPNGQDTEIWVYKNIDGVLKWVMEISSAVDPDLLQAIENAKKAGQDAQLAAEEAKTAANDAKEVGEEAKQAGEVAQLVANEAKNAAADAKQAGEEAQKVGENAKLAAENAKSAAVDAKAVGENAQLAANDAKHAGDTAIALAGQAQETAEQVNDRIGDVVIDIGDIQGDINAIVNEVGDVQTDISKIISDATATTSKANDAFNKASAVEGRTSTLETSVGSIKSTMTDIEMDLDSTTKKVNEVSTTVDGQTTEIASVKTTANSALSKANTVETTVDGVKTTLTSVQTKLDNQSGATRNYLKDSESLKISPHLGASITYTMDQTVSEWKATNAVRHQIAAGTGTNDTIVGTFRANRTVDPDTYYIHSIYISNIGTNRLRISSNLGSILSIEAGETKRVVFPAGRSSTGTPSMQFVFYRDSIDKDLDFIAWRAMIADGTIISSWAPNPDELATVTKVNELTTTVDGNTSKIASVETTSNSALSKANVAQSTADGNTTKITAAQTTATNALTKANTVEQTVDGQQTTITSIQNDLDNNITKINQITETVDGHTQLIASTTTTANSALTIANSVSSTVDGLTIKISSVETTANAANTKALQVEATTSGLTSTVTQVQTDLNNLSVGGRNYFKNSDVEVTNPVATRAEFLNDPNWDMAPIFDAYGVDRFYTISFDLKSKVSGNIQVYSQNGSGTKYNIGTTNIQATTTYQRYSITFKPTLNTNSTETRALLAFYGTYDSGRIPTVKNVKFELGNKATDWSPAVEDMATSSQFTQLATDINLKVSKGDVINQINVGTESILIAGNKLNITAQTTIDNAVIKTANIVDLAVSTAKISDLAVSEGKIGNLAVTNAKIANLSVTEGKIGDAAITNAKIGNLAVSEGKIANLAVTNAKIASLAVTEGKIGDAAITTAKIGNLAVSEAKIADLAVSSAKIANLAVTETKIGDAAITNAKIGNLAVSTAKIADGAIVNAKIGDAAITNAKIADASISSAKIINLDASKIVANTLATITTSTGALNVSGWLNITTTTGGIAGSFDYTETDAYRPRKFTGEWALSNQTQFFKGWVYTTSGTYQCYAESYFGLDYFKFRQYTQQSKATLMGRVDITGEMIELRNTFNDADDQNGIRLYSSGDAYFNGTTRVYGQLMAGNIDADTKRTQLTINYNRDLGRMLFAKDTTGRYILSDTIYNRTYNSQATVCITDAGTLGRIVSARKYKANIETASDVIDKAKLILTIQPSSWLDKNEVAQGIAKQRHYGFIADEFHEKGLGEVVIYNSKGEVEGLAYERLSMYQNVILTEHEQEIQRLKQEVSNLKTKVEELEAA